MALVNIPGLGPYFPPIPPFSFGNAATMINTSGLVIDATGEKIALIGRHWNKDRATKNIRNVGILFGAVTKAGGSGLTLSLQDVNATTGPPIQPDETQDQTVAIAAAAVTANTWLLSGNLSADRSVAFGELIAAVLEFDGGGRLGADSYALSSWVTAGAQASLVFQNVAVLKTASWAIQTTRPIVLFAYDDGTFGTIADCWPVSAHSGITINSGTTPDEYGLEFQVTAPMKTDGCWMAMFITANADLDVVLYEGSTAMGIGVGGATSISIDNDQLGADGVYRVLDVTFPTPVSLSANTTYRLMAKPTTGTSLVIPGMDVSAAGHMQAVPMGANFNSASRTDGGTFTALTTRRPFMGLRLAGMDGGGAATLVNSHALVG